jgi:hypothetical protein
MADILGIWPDFSLRQILGLITSDRVPRPFYVVGHNTNSIGEIEAALAVGANAVEIDVNVYEDRQDTLCVSEAGGLDSDEGGAPGAPEVHQFLMQLRAVADSNPENLALVIFDCKPKAATADLGRRILDLARSSLSDTGLNIILSVASLDNHGIFDQVRDDLRDREGLMIDEENDPSAVLQFFDGVAHPCYGNGIAAAFQTPTLSPHVRPSIERACAIRTSFGKLKFVYTWTIGEEDDLREYIRIGANAIIPGESPSSFDAAMTSKLRAITSEPEFRHVARIANRFDNPFKRPETAYSLHVHTGDVHNAGTDANVKFTLTGSLGSVSKWIDTSLIGSILGKTPGRMERNAWDFVTIESLNLGQLISVAVQRDDEGNAPGWFLDQIIVWSSHYGVHLQANFNRWIDTTDSFTQPLV